MCIGTYVFPSHNWMFTWLAPELVVYFLHVHRFCAAG